MNVLTFDVEEWFQGTSFTPYIRQEEWSNYSSRVGEEISKLLGMLDRFGVKATFFILGVIAREHPEVVREIDQAGHEIGIHGYHHLLVCKMNREEFRREISQAKELIEGIIGKKIEGHRAPSWSIISSTNWALLTACLLF